MNLPSSPISVHYASRTHGLKAKKKVFPQAIFVEQNNASNKLTAKKNTYMYYERGVK